MPVVSGRAGVDVLVKPQNTKYRAQGVTAYFFDEIKRDMPVLI